MTPESAPTSASLRAIRGDFQRAALSTSTMNLVVWMDDESRRGWVLERAEMLGEKYPSFTLILDRTGHCPKASEGHGRRELIADASVQDERVVLDVSCASAETIEEVVNDFCPPGVPTVLWWSGTKLHDSDDAACARALVRHMEKVIVDSSAADRDADSLANLVRFHGQRPEVEVRDLAWLRLRPWQDMIAHFFDEPALLAELYSIVGLHVSSGSDAEAFYLGGWLASRLGWTASGRDAFTDPTGRTIPFTRRRVGEIRRVASVCLDSTTSWYHGELTEDPSVVRVWVEGEHAREPRLFTLSQIDNASLLERAVLETGLDEVFETALRSAGTLLG